LVSGSVDGVCLFVVDELRWLAGACRWGLRMGEGIVERPNAGGGDLDS
jgi:hypothetical protein